MSNGSGNGKDNGQVVGSPVDVRTKVKVFADALRLALYDRALESAGQEIRYYFDADVILRMIWGFQYTTFSSNIPANAPGTSPAERMVRALLSCGLLGEVRVTRPHALEVLNNIPGVGKESRSVFHRAGLEWSAKKYLGNEKIKSVLGSLREVVVEAAQQSGAYRDVLAMKFFDTLRDNAQLFPELEAISGSPAQRLRRYHDKKLISFRNLGPSIEEVVANDPERDVALQECWDVLERLGAHIRREPSNRLSNFRDAAALATLRYLGGRKGSAGARTEVRFYSETYSLRNAWEQIRDRVAYESIAEALPRRQRAIVENLETRELSRVFDIYRDQAYFIMRSSFRELHPWNGHVAAAELEELTSLLEGLTELLRRSDAELAAGVAEQTWDGGRLQERLNRFADLNLTDSLWTDGEFVRHVGEMMPEWTDVFAFAQGEKEVKLLEANIEHIRAELTEEVRGLVEWQRVRESLQTSMDRALEKTGRKVGPIEDVRRDLGLVRWGMALSKDESERVISEVSRLLAPGSAEEVSIVLFELTNLVRYSETDVREAIVASALLWALGAWEWIVDVAERLESRGNGIPLALSLMATAARLRSGRIEGFNGRKAAVEAALRSCGVVSGVDRNNKLGLGYVLFHAWKSETGGRRGISKGRSERVAEASKWAAMSLDMAKGAIDEFERGDLEWAYALNHFVYVSIETGGRWEDVERHFEELMSLHGADSWNYRFADTIGTVLLRRFEGEREQWAVVPAHRRSKLAENMHLYLISAEPFLIEAQERTLGDIDIERHMELFRACRAWMNQQGI